MNFFTKKETSKKIIIAILLVMSFNFITPTISQSADLNEFGGSLFKPVFDFVCGVADLVLEMLHYYFTGNGKFMADEVNVQEFDEIFCEIRYSPGIIFSNKVPGLQTNFINGENTMSMKREIINTDKWVDTCSLEECAKNRNFSYKILENESIEIGASWADGIYPLDVEFYYSECTVQGSDKTFYLLSIYTECSDEIWYQWITDGLSAMVNGVSTVVTKLVADYGQWNYLNNFSDLKFGWNHWVCTTSEESVTMLTSTSYLTSTISSWYVAIRAIVLVALLSVLVYIGIRIIISSTSQDKAKYKKMIWDWLVAIFLLFILHYLMLFITEICESVTNILIDENNYVDEFMSSIRSKFTYQRTFVDEFKYLILYVVLVIYTVIFSLQYLRRMLYLAFFTMIAPLVAFTYPLDKIKDGQAQAFTMWLREYIFNSLIQPVHLLLYVVLVSSAQALVETQWLYAVVAIGFIVPAEKFFRKMFGFDKASSIGQSGAAAVAGGALVMSAINSLGKRGGKKSGSSGGTGNSGESGNTTRFVPPPGENSGSGSPSGSPNGSPSGSPNGSPSGSPSGTPRTTSTRTSGTTPGSTNQTWAPPSKPAKDRVKYGVKPALRGAGTLAGRFVKKGGKMLGKGLIGAAGATALGTVGLAAGIATGDASNAFQYALTGGTAGFMGANALASKTSDIAKGTRDTFEESALGTDEHNIKKSTRELSKDSDFKRVCSHLGAKTPAQQEALIRQFHSNGIKSPSDIKKAMNIRAKTGVDQDQVIYAHKIKQQIERYDMKREDVKQLLREENVPENLIKDAMDIIEMW